MTSYFEIGGMIVEAHLPVDGSSEPPRIFRRLLSESPRIQSSYGLMDTQDPQGLKVSKGPAAQGVAGGSPHVDEWGRASIGSMMVRTGAAMLLIPDPLEPVSTPIAAGLVIAGVALHATTW